MPYKRNQIEEAISRLFDPKSKAVPARVAHAHQATFLVDRSLPRSGRKIPKQAQTMRSSAITLLGAAAPIPHSRSMTPGGRPFEPGTLNPRAHPKPHAAQLLAKTCEP